MIRIAATSLALLLAVTPLAAQETGETPADREDITEGVDLLSQGAKRLLRGLMGEVEPQMRDLAEALKEWEFEGLTLDDMGQYHPPEVLPNGDIIIRRKVPLVAEPDPNAEIEL